MEEVLTRSIPRTPWVRIIQRGEFPGGMGDTINILTYERVAPTTVSTWSNVVTTDGQEGGSCLPPAKLVTVGSTTRNFNLQRLVLQGPDFCAEDLRTPFEIMAQLNAIMNALVDYARVEWEIRDRAEYFRFSKRKVVVGGASLIETNTMATTYFGSCPGSVLTQGVLDTYRLKLIRDGAGESALALENGSAILTAILSAETSNDLIMRNDDIRQDFRWAEPAELLKPLGVTRSYKGFYHLIDETPRRFSCAAGVYTEILAWSDTAATKGNKSEINTSWEAATIEESFIFDPTVFRQLIPRPVINPAPNFRFDPVNYMGKWMVRNIIDRDCNPDGNILYHRGILAAGSMPVHPERGVAIVSLRCNPLLSLTNACT